LGDKGVEFTIDLTADEAKEDSTFIWNKLFQYNLQYTEHDQHTFLRVFARNERGELIAGLLGETFWSWLHINILWVHEQHRHKGLGNQLMTRAEAEAIRRGCRHADVDTLDFQAPDFYRRLGYVVWGVLDDLPPEHQRIFFR
jgi:GNAT superfamily N-acetyltransferase